MTTSGQQDNPTNAPGNDLRSLSDEDRRALAAIDQAEKRLAWMRRMLTEPGVFHETGRALLDGAVLIFTTNIAINSDDEGAPDEHAPEEQRAEFRRRAADAAAVLAGAGTSADQARAVRRELALSGKKLTEFFGDAVDEKARERMVAVTITAIGQITPELGRRARKSRDEIRHVLDRHDENRGGREVRHRGDDVESATRAVLAKLGLPRKPPRARQ